MKTIKSLCSPALIYLVISVIGFVYFITSLSIISLAVKAFFIFVWTWFLNFLCRKGYSGISWFLVLFPFVLMLLGYFFAKDVEGFYLGAGNSNINKKKVGKNGKNGKIVIVPPVINTTTLSVTPGYAYKEETICEPIYSTNNPFRVSLRTGYNCKIIKVAI